MPGTLGYGWHESNRGEYLAQYFLAALGVSAPVIRQEDIGVDFFCSLAKEDNKKLTFHSPFMVQHGADGAKRFAYGGYDKVDNEKWRRDEISWLFSQELPLFLCVTDREKGHFQLYSTSAMWLLRYHFGGMTSVVLCPDEKHDPLKESRGEKIGKDGHGDGYEYHVPLGNPIVDVDFLGLKKEIRTKAIESLRRAIVLEQTNITMRRLGVHVASWFTEISPNDPTSLEKHASSVFWDGSDEKHSARQIESLKDIVITLALNLQAHAQADSNEKLTYLLPVFRLFKKSDIPNWILIKLPKQAVENLQAL